MVCVTGQVRTGQVGIKSVQVKFTLTGQVGASQLQVAIVKLQAKSSD